MIPRARQVNLERAVQAVVLPGDWAEFGVSSGKTARLLLEKLPQGRSLWLFDSFRGLPRAWGDRGRGAFACPIPVFEDERARLVVGSFEETVSRWALGRSEALGLVHIDCDLYESTKAVLEGLRGLLLEGTVLAFDEFEDHRGEERRAWEESGYVGECLHRASGKAVFRLTTTPCSGPQ